MEEDLTLAERAIYAATWAAVYAQHRPAEVAMHEAYRSVMMFRAQLHGCFATTKKLPPEQALLSEFSEWHD